MTKFTSFCKCFVIYFAIPASLFFFIDINKEQPIEAQRFTLYILDVLISEHNISRFYEQYNCWIKNLVKNSKHIIVKAGSTYKNSVLDTVLYNHSTTPHIFWARQRTYDFIYPFINGLIDFVNNTNFRWFIRTTDDVYVNIPKLSTFLDNLEEIHDPLSDYVVKGSIAGDPASPFLHGGSGWLMSRFAAQKYLEDYFSNVPNVEKTGDDVVASKYFRGSVFDFECPEFHGYPLTKESLFYITHRTTNYTRCKSKSCKYPANKIAVWHSGEPLMTVITHSNNLIFPNNTCIENDKTGRSYICLLNSHG